MFEPGAVVVVIAGAFAGLTGTVAEPVEEQTRVRAGESGTTCRVVLDVMGADVTVEVLANWVRRADEHNS